MLKFQKSTYTYQLQCMHKLELINLQQLQQSLQNELMELKLYSGIQIVNKILYSFLPDFLDMFKYLGFNGAKKQEIKKQSPQSLGRALKYKNAIDNIETKMQVLNIDMEGQTIAVAYLDGQILELLEKNDQSKAKEKLSDLKGYQRQFESNKLKWDVLNEMRIQMEKLGQYTNLLDVYTNEVSISKDQINDQLLNAMLDYNSYLQSNMDKYLGLYVVDKQELEEAFSQYQNESLIQQKEKERQDIRNKIKAINEDMDKEQIFVANLNKQIHDLLSQNKYQEAIDEIAKLKDHQQQIDPENTQNQLAQLIIQLESLEGGKLPTHEAHHQGQIQHYEIKQDSVSNEIKDNNQFMHNDKDLDDKDLVDAQFQEVKKYVPEQDQKILDELQ